jgi:RimJ/RimL family protein N-acetyltransferase
MEIIKLDYVLYKRHHRKWLKFIQQYGDQRITHTVRKWFASISPEEFEQPGTDILIAVGNRLIVGISGFSQYGLQHSFAVIHPDHRSHGIGKEMLQTHIQHLGKVYTRVALDNIPSMKVCFSNQMVAFKLFNGPTGKPTLWFGGGQWSQKDVENVV